MKDFQVDLLDFEINELNNTPSESNNINNENLFNEKSLDFNDNLKNSKKTLDEIAISNNNVENIIFPDDNEMPQLDEDIINLELTSGEEILPNSIQPLADADTVFNSSLINKI